MSRVASDHHYATLSIAANWLTLVLLVAIQAGYSVDWKQLEQVPSVCCGACGG